MRFASVVAVAASVTCGFGLFVASPASAQLSIGGLGGVGGISGIRTGNLGNVDPPGISGSQNSPSRQSVGTNSVIADPPPESASDAEGSNVYVNGSITPENGNGVAAHVKLDPDDLAFMPPVINVTPGANGVAVYVNDTTAAVNGTSSTSSSGSPSTASPPEKTTDMEGSDLFVHADVSSDSGHGVAGNARVDPDDLLFTPPVIDALADGVYVNDTQLTVDGH